MNCVNIRLHGATIKIKKNSLCSIITQDMINKDIIQRIKAAKVMFNNKKQLLCSNDLSLEIKKKPIKSSLSTCAPDGHL